MLLKVKRLVQEYAWAFYLGCILGLYGHTIMTLSYYIIVIPTILLMIWANDIDKN